MTSAPCEAGTHCSAQGCVAQSAGPGASCAAADVCDPLLGVYCNLTGGLCEPLPAPVAAGERCATFDVNGGPLGCAADATCFAMMSGVTAARFCVAKADLGQACDASKGKQCKAPGVCAGGSCVMPSIVEGGRYNPPACR